MITPDDLVARLWDLLVAGPPQLGRSEAHPLVHGSLRAIGVLFVPIGFLLFVTLVVFVVSIIAVIYDVIEVSTRPFRDRRRV